MWESMENWKIVGAAVWLTSFLLALSHVVLRV